MKKRLTYLMMLLMCITIAFANTGVLTPGIAVGAGASSIAGNQIQLWTGGVQLYAINSTAFQIASNKLISWSSTSASNGSNDLYLSRNEGATLQLGIDATNAIPQTIKSHDGSGTNIIGADLNIAAGQGTGTNVGGSLVLRTAPAGTVIEPVEVDADVAVNLTRLIVIVIV